MRGIFHLFGDYMALVAGERATVRAAAQVHLVSAHAERRNAGISQGVERRRFVLFAAVAELALASHVVDDAIDVTLGRDDVLVGVDDVCVARIAAIGLRM